MKRVFRISGLLAVLLLMSGEVMAAGLGKLSVASALGQPLRAEIELLAVQSEDIATVEARLASADAYRQAHIDRSSVLSGLHFNVEKRASGQPVVRITSSAPVNDPFVDLLVELNWSSGRILREYTVLLDTAASPLADAEKGALPMVAPTVSATPASTQATLASGSATTDKSAAKGASQARRSYGPVKSGETLRGIAGKLLPADVSLDMMMASLYHANQGAFAKRNMNLLKKGQVLSVPDRDSVMRQYSPSQAKQLIQEQSVAWHSMQNRLADQAMRSPAAQVKEQSAESGKVMPAQTAPRPAAPPATKDVLKLSKGQPARVAADADKRAHDLEDEVTAKSRELQDAQGRISQLEKTVQDLQNLMQLKSQQGGQKAEPVADQSAAAEPKTEVKPKSLPRPSVTQPAVPEEPGFLSALLASPLYIAGGLAALLLAGLLWLFMVSNRRRKGLSNFEQSIMTGGDQFKTSIFKTTSGAKTEHGAATQSGATTDFSRLGLGSIDSHEVDPIAEAEVYMAYGRDAQAEEILRDALTKEPRRHEIALKLLEIYAARQDKASFETQASELYADLGDPANDMWQKAAEMGRGIDPDNPLYRMFGEAPSRPVETAGEQTDDATAEQLAEALAVERQPEMAGDLEMAVEATPEAHETGLDSAAQTEPSVKLADDDMKLGFDLEPSAEAPAFRPDRNEFDSLAESFPAFGKEVPAAVAGMVESSVPALTETESPVAHGEELGDLDLMPESMDLTMATAPVIPEPAGEPLKQDMAVKLPDLDFSGLDLELTTPSESPSETVVAQPVAEMAAPLTAASDLFEEASTKLDLAKAYLEMGDKEGAREILSEVLKEGDNQQQEAARALMAEIG